MDLDKLRIFHTVAVAGSFTHAGEKLSLSQSAVSRQISSLEDSLATILFHRHARGLILTEQGELLFQTTEQIIKKLAHIQAQIMDSRNLAEGPLMITIAEFMGATWLLPRLPEFRDANPGIQLTLLFDDRILNLGMREADAALRLSKSEQGDLIQRNIGTIHFHICASSAYLERFGTPSSLKDLKNHKLLGFPDNAKPPFADPNWLLEKADLDMESTNVILMNSMNAIFKAVEKGVGIGFVPDYLIDSNPHYKMILPDVIRPPVDMYFVYAEERRNFNRISIFRDFLLRHVADTKFKI